MTSERLGEMFKGDSADMYAGKSEFMKVIMVTQVVKGLPVLFYSALYKYSCTDVMYTN